MSGIYGYYHTDTPAASFTDSCKKALTYWNSSYGSDSLDMEEEHLWMGVRLEHLSAKIPVQPDSLETAQYASVIDAVIYNRTELGQMYHLNLPEYSDEQLIFHIITVYGIKALAQINGDFAGVLYEKSSHKITLFRDHMGIRPLFYYIDENRFIFSTDMRAFLAMTELKLSINEDYLYYMMTGRLTATAHECDFQEIHKVKNASWYTVTDGNGGLHISSPATYWKMGEHKIRLNDEKAYTSELRRLIEESIERRLDAIDGIVGAELSGGLDSSVLSILIHRLGREGRYFSWSESPDTLPILSPADERNIISDICRQEHISVTYKAKHGPIDISQMLDTLSPPYANTFSISECSKYFHSQGVKAVISGHGGDEGVSHRSNLYELFYHGEYLHYIKAIYRSKGGQNLRVFRSVQECLRQILFFRKRLSTMGRPDDTLDLINPTFLQKIQTTKKTIPFTFAYDALTYFQQGFPMKRPVNTAFQAAQCGVRYLFPYLDYKVADYAVSIPRWLYNDGIQNRKIYIEAFRDIMPDSLIKYFSKTTISRQEKESATLKEKINRFNHDIDILNAELDPELWAPYLDFEKLRTFHIPSDTTEEQLITYAYELTYLLYCAMLQHTWVNANKYQ